MAIMRRNRGNADYPGFPRMIDRFFDDFWRNWEEESTVWTPRLDIKEKKDAYVVDADIPGMKKEEINVSLQNNVLTLQGDRRYEDKKEDENRYYEERTYGSFRRSVTLPTKVDESKVKAEYKDGVLHLTLPKSEEAKSREIEIQ